MSRNVNERNDRRQRVSSVRNLDFQKNSQPISQFANLFSQPTGRHQPFSPLAQVDHQQSEPQNERRESLSQFSHAQPFTQLLHSQQSTFSQPSQHLSYIETPEDNAYHEQRHHFHTTQSEYRNPEDNAYHEQRHHFHTTQSEFRTPEPVVSRQGRKGKEKEVVEPSHTAGYRLRWQHWEDIILAKCWCNKTESMYDSREAKFWGAITDMYNEDVMKEGGIPRDLKALQNRWHQRMRPQCTNYMAAYKKVMRKVQSGENHAKSLERVKKQYNLAHPKKEEFQFLHVIDILMNCQKFCATSTDGDHPTLDNVDLEYLTTPQSGQYYTDTPDTDQGSNNSSGKRKSTSESNTDDADAVNSPAKSGRPEGVKRRKMKAKKSLDQILEMSPEAEATRKMRLLELNFENDRLAHHKRALKLKERQEVRQWLTETRELAETPEEIATWRTKKLFYLNQWMEEDGAPGSFPSVD